MAKGVDVAKVARALGRRIVPYEHRSLDCGRAIMKEEDPARAGQPLYCSKICAYRAMARRR